MISTEEQVNKLSFDHKDDLYIKILGFHWELTEVEFIYHSDSVDVQLTKRIVLSCIAKIYDPFWAKCFM